jgi:hypothetical protein
VSVSLEFRVRITIVTPLPHACTTAPPYLSTTTPYTSTTASTLGFVRSFQFHLCLFQSPWVKFRSRGKRKKLSNKKKFCKKNSGKKSQIRIQVGLTRFLLVQSEFSPNWTVLSVFDSKLQLAITFAYELCFRRATTQNAQHKKFYLATAKVKFLPSEILDPEISAHIHLYLAF